jgi:myosin heavy subunit
MWKYISFPDNQDVLDWIDMKHTGVLALLDEQCILPMIVRLWDFSTMVRSLLVKSAESLDFFQSMRDWMASLLLRT